MISASRDLDAVLALLRIALGAEPTKEDIEHVDAASSTSIVEIASAHAILPLLADAVRVESVSSRLDPEFVDFVVAMRERNAERNAALRRQLGEIGEIFDSAGIAGVVLKGGAEVLAPAGPEGARFVLDLDILVPPVMLEGAAAALREHGYVFLAEVDDFLTERHLPALRREGAPAVVELHRRIGNGRWNDALPPDEIFGRTQVSPFAGLAVPAADVRYLHALIHTQVDGTPGVPMPVKLRDLAELEFLGRRLSSAEHAKVARTLEGAGIALEANGMLAIKRKLLRSAEAASDDRARMNWWSASALEELRAPGRRRNRYVRDWLVHYARRFASSPDVRASYLGRLFKPAYLRMIVRHHLNQLANIR